MVVNMKSANDVDLEVLDLATLSWLAGSAANDHLLAAIRKAGHPQLRISHGYVFQLLIAAPRTVGEIAESLGVTQQAASKFVAELTSLGYLAVLSAPTDRRVRRVALSGLGEKAVSDARAARRKLEKKLAAEVGDDVLLTARKALIALLGATGGLEASQRRRARPPNTL
jgi:DNA-binding MarR family transcriptional regulator